MIFSQWVLTFLAGAIFISALKSLSFLNILAALIIIILSVMYPQIKKAAHKYGEKLAAKIKLH